MLIVTKKLSELCQTKYERVSTISRMQVIEYYLSQYDAENLGSFRQIATSSPPEWVTVKSWSLD